MTTHKYRLGELVQFLREPHPKLRRCMVIERIILFDSDNPDMPETPGYRVAFFPNGRRQLTVQEHELELYDPAKG